MNTIEDMGPLEHDELPRLFRSFVFSEDVLKPGWLGLFSLGICFGPAAVMAALKGDTQQGQAMAIALLAAGTALFPAVAITRAAGDLADLRPDRLLGMIGVCGRSYLALLIAFVPAAGVYALGLILSQFVPFVEAIPFLAPLAKYRWQLGFPVLTVGIYLMHWFCWSAGLVYRRHVDEFPWTWQKYFKEHPGKGSELERTPRDPTTALRRPPAARRPARPPVSIRPLPVQDQPVRGFPVIPLPVEEPPPLPIPADPIDPTTLDPPAGPTTPKR
jgi:hypothetical protein